MRFFFQILEAHFQDEMNIAENTRLQTFDDMVVKFREKIKTVPRLSCDRKLLYEI